jgi:hypothetical protein
VLEELLSKPLFWKIALALLAPLLFWLGFRRWRYARLIDDTPTSRVRSAAQGYVELSGRARLTAGANLLSPLSRRPCVWWLFRIERKRSNGKNTQWETINRGVSELPFLLVDETGECLVKPQGAEVHPGDKAVWYGATPWPAGQPDASGFFGGRMLAEYRYTEHRIYEHERVDVIGAFHSVGGLAAFDRDAAVAELLRQWKQDQPRLLAEFDADRDGLLSQREWERARAAARHSVDARALAPTEPQLHVLTKPDDGRPFLLAAGGLSQIARRYRWQARFSLAGFVVVVAVLAAWILG